MTFENVYVVHHGNYVLKIPRKLENNFLLTLCIFGYFNLIEQRKKVWIYHRGNKCLSSRVFLYIIRIKQLFSKQYTEVISWQILLKFSLTNAKCVEVGCYNLHIIVLPLIAKLYEDYEEKKKFAIVRIISAKLVKK